MNKEKKTFYLTIALYSHREKPSYFIKSYVERLEGKEFFPHRTRVLYKKERVFLEQKIPFHLDFQKNFRTEVAYFRLLSQKYRLMLEEISREACLSDLIRSV